MEQHIGILQEGAPLAQQQLAYWLEAVLPFSRALGVMLALIFVLSRARRVQQFLRGR